MSKIINLSEAASIALHAMIIIARSKDPINADKIAEIIGSSRHHVAKVMQRLIKGGYIASTRGPAGGFYLVKDKRKITLLEVYESIEGKIIASNCPVDKPVCSFDKCFVNNITYKMTLDFKNYLKSQTLSEYI
jgi:Rrf2 family protein